MKINIRQIIKDHNKKTGERVTQTSLAQEMFEAGIFKSRGSAMNMIQYNSNGKAQCLYVQLIEFLKYRFGLTLNEIIS